VVTHQLQVERRTRKVRQSETDVAPLCHATRTIRDTRCYFNVRSKADISQLNLPHDTRVLFLCPRLWGHFGIARSVRVSVPWHSCLGYIGTLAACSLATAGHHSPEMCGVRSRPRTDVDPPRFLPQSNCRRRGHIVSPGLPWGWNFYPHTHPIPIPMGIHGDLHTHGRPAYHRPRGGAVLLITNVR